jgi:hypothetical protein
MGRRRAMPNRDVEMNQGLLRGASYYPTDLLGAPVDLINMALKPMGLGSQKPVMGSDYLQSLAQQYGLSQQPTGSNAENVARLAMSAMNPATGARAVGKVIEPTMQALGPKAYGLLEDYMVKSGGMIPLTAYHGTPHNIQGKFDINKVGTGEGAQAYGYGMYFAENPAVATQYKNILSKPEFTKTGEGIELRGQLPRMLNESYDELVAKNGIQQTNYGDVTDIVGQRLDRQMKDALKANDMDWYNKTADMKLDLARFKENPPPNVGNLYKVDIPDADIPNMLDWDTPLSQQPTVLQSIKNLSQRSDLPRGFDKAIDKALGDKYFDGQDLYYELTKVYKDPLMLRQAMQESGFTGIRYLDEGSRNFRMLTPEESTSGKYVVGKWPGTEEQKYFDNAKEAQDYFDKNKTSNFVVFDPTDVKMLEKNDEPIEGLLY